MIGPEGGISLTELEQLSAVQVVPRPDGFAHLAVVHGRNSRSWVGYGLQLAVGQWETELVTNCLFCAIAAGRSRDHRC